VKSLIVKSSLFAVMAVVTIVASILSPEPDLADGAGVVMELPEDIPGYIGVEYAVSDHEKKVLPENTQHARRVYYPYGKATEEDARMESVRVAIVLGGNDRRSLHRPEICLVGQGWNIMRRSVKEILIGDKVLPVMDLELERVDEVKGGEKVRTRAHYLYWWVGKNTSTPYVWKRLLITYKDQLVDNISNRWAYPSVFVYVHPKDGQTDKEADDEAIQRAAKVMNKVVPKFQKQMGGKPQMNTD